MHDHSRFQRDINDVTGASLSLSLSQKSLTHNIGSASALPIIRDSDSDSYSDLFILIGRIAEKVKCITSLGCAPARREGSRTENWKVYEE